MICVGITVLMKKALKNGPETNLYHLFAENRGQATVLRFNSAFEAVRTAG